MATPGHSLPSRVTSRHRMRSSQQDPNRSIANRSAVTLIPSTCIHKHAFTRCINKSLASTAHELNIHCPGGALRPPGPLQRCMRPSMTVLPPIHFRFYSPEHPTPTSMLSWPTMSPDAALSSARPGGDLRTSDPGLSQKVKTTCRRNRRVTCPMGPAPATSAQIARLHRPGAKPPIAGSPNRLRNRPERYLFLFG